MSSAIGLLLSHQHLLYLNNNQSAFIMPYSAIQGQHANLAAAAAQVHAVHNQVLAPPLSVSGRFQQWKHTLTL